MVAMASPFREVGIPGPSHHHRRRHRQKAADVPVSYGFRGWIQIWRASARHSPSAARAPCRPGACGRPHPAARRRRRTALPRGACGSPRSSGRARPRPSPARRRRRRPSSRSRPRSPRGDLMGGPRRRVRPAGDRPGVDAEPVVRPDAAREALGELLAPEADVPRRCPDRLLDGHALRRVEVRDAGRASATTCSPSSRSTRPSSATTRSGRSSGGGSRRDLGRPADVRGEPAGRVAAVARGERPAVAPVDRDVFA